MACAITMPVRERCMSYVSITCEKNILKIDLPWTANFSSVKKRRDAVSPGGMRKDARDKKAVDKDRKELIDPQVHAGWSQYTNYNIGIPSTTSSALQHILGLDLVALGERSGKNRRFSSRLGPLRKSISWLNGRK